MNAPIVELWRELFSRDLPGKIVCVGLNYADHTGETGFEAPPTPLLFGKFANTVIGPDDAISIPVGVGHVDAEAELAIVIGGTASHVSRARALEYVCGYTAANDVSARDIQFADGQWMRGKGFDTFCPVLPKVVPLAELGDASNLMVEQRLNGNVIQRARTSDLIFDVPTLVSFVSSMMTLEPGDLILTGTPSGVGYFREPKVSLCAGDVVEVKIESIGTLTNHVVAGRPTGD